MQKRWRVQEETPGLALDVLPNLHPIASTLLAHRGLTTIEQARSFLEPSWDEGIHDPFLFFQMKEAVMCTLEALRQGKKITVHGDYDADGVTGSTLVLTTLRDLAQRLGSDPALVDFYIPHRDKEGYGLRMETVQRLKDQGTRLLITVDCGIACVDEIAVARAADMDVIVLDHHQFGDTLPDGYLIHPHLPHETYPREPLAAVGVSWKFACALLQQAREQGVVIPEGWEKWLLDLVSIATVTDMVPLRGENRVLLTYGLKVLNKTRRVGLQKLIEMVGRRGGELTSESIGFMLGPRINAAGRMDHANLALELLMSESDDEASKSAERLEEQNRRRQKAVEQMMKQADAFLDEHQDQTKDSAIIVIWHPEWSPSLVGLVAGRLLDRLGKPCVAIGKCDGVWIGSGRSIEAYDITAAVKRAGEGLLTRSGGHPQACGCSLAKDEDVPRFAERLIEDAAQHLTQDMLGPELLIEVELPLRDINWKLIQTIQAFEPFGVGNVRPTFVARGVEVIEARTVGAQQQHLRCILRDPMGALQTCIGFKLGSRAAEVQVGGRLDVVYDVSMQEWNGRQDIQCKMIDFHT